MIKTRYFQRLALSVQRLPVAISKLLGALPLYTLILMGIFVVPHGIGYRFSIGHIDIPRLVLLATIAYWFLGQLMRYLNSKISFYEPGTTSISLLVIWILISAITSSNPLASFILAGQLCLLWFVFCFAFTDIFDFDHQYIQMNRSLIVIYSILFLFGLYEVIFQKYLIPHYFRTSFWGISGYDWITSRVLYRSNTILAQGPFMWNHALSGLCAAGSGIAIYAMEKEKKWGVIFFYCFTMLLIATGVRAGFYGVATAYLLYSIWAKKFSVILHFGLAAVVAEIFYQVDLGSNAPTFYSIDIAKQYINEFPPWQNTVKAFGNFVGEIWFLPSQLEEYLLALGTVGVKIMGFLLNVGQLEEWWLLGYGFGSFQRPSQIMSNAIPYDDPGLIQLIFLESGLVAGCLLVYILTRAIILGLKYDNMRYYSVGILAWSTFALSSWAIWPLLLVMIFVLLIFNHHRMHLKSIAEKRHSLH